MLHIPLSLSSQPRRLRQRAFLSSCFQRSSAFYLTPPPFRAASLAHLRLLNPIAASCCSIQAPYPSAPPNLSSGPPLTNARVAFLSRDSFKRRSPLRCRTVRQFRKQQPSSSYLRGSEPAHSQFLPSVPALVTLSTCLTRSSPNTSTRCQTFSFSFSFAINSVARRVSSCSVTFFLGQWQKHLAALPLPSRTSRASLKSGVVPSPKANLPWFGHTAFPVLHCVVHSQANFCIVLALSSVRCALAGVPLAIRAGATFCAATAPRSRSYH
ncbi:hypothetical protein TRVL_01834 [Trypanosoma vivax]|nr:hypothetical protein TRVL_01834 [Trypanosoma vivax]